MWKISHIWITSCGLLKLCSKVVFLFFVCLFVCFFCRISVRCLVSFLFLSVCLLCHFICVWLCVTLWSAACHAPLSMGFSRQEYWSGLPWSPPGDLPYPGIELASLSSNMYCQAGSLPLAPPGKPSVTFVQLSSPWSCLAITETRIQESFVSEMRHRHKPQGTIVRLSS